MSSRLERITRAFTGDYFRRFVSREMARELTDLLQDDFDAVVVEAEEMASYVRLSKPGVPWVLDTQNVPSVVARRARQAAEGAKSRLAAWFDYRSALAFEKSLFPRFSAVTAVSELERKNLVARFGGISAHTVPNGVDSDLLLRPASLAVDEHLLNFTGSFEYPPNRDAVRYFCASIFPLILERDGKVRLQLIGKGSDGFAASLPPALPVTGLGYVEDAASHFAGAAALVVPLRVGGGTRIKILTAIAMGTPVVATSVGAEGLELDESCGLLVADNSRDFADLTLKVLHDPRPREQARTIGRARVARAYTWESAARKLENVLQDAVHRIDKQERTR